MFPGEVSMAGEAYSGHDIPLSGLRVTEQRMSYCHQARDPVLDLLDQGFFSSGPLL